MTSKANAAPPAVVGKATSWSFSRWVDYEKCPLSFGLKHVRKLQEPKNAAMGRGADVHELAAKFLTGKVKDLPPELALFRDLFVGLRERRLADENSVVVEDTWAFTQDWAEQCAWDDWDRCWVRIKLDCMVLNEVPGGWSADVRDWKTGKFRDGERALYEKQLELYAVGAMLLYPDVVEVRPSLVYLDSSLVWAGADPARPTRFTRNDLPRLAKGWSKAALPVLSDRAFRPTPGDHCRWCWFGQDGRKKGGPGLCKF